MLNSDTTSGIQIQYGGGAAGNVITAFRGSCFNHHFSTLRLPGALKLDPLDLFLRDHNKNDKYEKAVQNFIHSCAG